MIVWVTIRHPAPIGDIIPCPIIVSIHDDAHHAEARAHAAIIATHPLVWEADGEHWVAADDFGAEWTLERHHLNGPPPVDPRRAVAVEQIGPQAGPDVTA